MDLNNVHGTACAEIIYDMAPEAELYLAAVDDRIDQIALATLWLIQNNVDIISFSGGTHDGPHNGNSLLDQMVNKVVLEKNILWVNAAGNEGDDQWIGNTTDHNGNSLIDVPDTESTDIILIDHIQGDLQLLTIWDNWGGNPQLPAANQDIDIYLLRFEKDSEEFVPVATSENPQNGRGEPIEFIMRRNAVPGIYALRLIAKNINQSVKIRVIQNSPGELLPTVATGSIGILATAHNALAVGAVNVETGELSSYSSHCPTDDGRLKPEVNAPDNNLTLAYGNSPGQPGRFPGTSAACPHVSGFAALFKEMNPNSSVHELRQSVIQHVRVIGQAPNNQYGHRHIDASGVQVAGEDTESATEQTLSTEESLELLKPLLDLAE